MFNRKLICCYLYIITKHGYPPPARDALSHLEEMKRLGFQSVELEGIREEHLLEVYEQRFAIKERLAALNLSVPYFCAVLPGLSSSDEKTRERNLALLRKGCETAALFGAKGVLDNAPLPPYQFEKDIPIVRHYEEAILRKAKFPSQLKWDEYWQALVETYREVCDIAAEFVLTYQLHPCLGVLAATTDAFLYFHDAVQRDNLRFSFDTANQFVLKDNLALSLRRLAEHIDYIHLSDNRGRQVEHLALSEGVIHWETFFETLDVIGFDGDIGIDIGGAESEVSNLDRAYIHSAEFVEKRLTDFGFWIPRRRGWSDFGSRKKSPRIEEIH